MDVKIEELGKRTVEWAFAQRMMTQRFDVTSIDRRYLRHVNRAAKRAAPQLVRQDPYPGSRHRVEGVIRELIREVDLPKRMGLDPGSLGAEYVAKQFPRASAQVTIHTGAIGDDAKHAPDIHDPESFTFFVERSAIAEFIVGDFISVMLFGVEVPGAGVSWLAH